MTLVLVLLYLWKGILVLEQDPMPSKSVCAAMGEARVEALEQDPRYGGMVLAGCLPIMAQQATKNDF